MELSTKGSRTDDATSATLTTRLNDVVFRALLGLNNGIGSVNALAVVTVIITELQMYSFLLDGRLLLMKSEWTKIALLLRFDWVFDDILYQTIAYIVTLLLFSIAVVLVIFLGMRSVNIPDRPIDRFERIVELVLATVLPSCLLIPALNITINLLTCHSPMVDSLQCGSFRHVVMAMFSFSVALIIVAIAHFYESVFYDATPIMPTPTVLARSSWRYHTDMVIVRFFLIGVSVLQVTSDPGAGDSRPWTLAIAIAFAFHYSAYSLISNQPYTSPTVMMIATISSWIRMCMVPSGCLAAFFKQPRKLTFPQGCHRRHYSERIICILSGIAPSKLGSFWHVSTGIRRLRQPRWPRSRNRSMTVTCTTPY